ADLLVGVPVQRLPRLAVDEHHVLAVQVLVGDLLVAHIREAAPVLQTVGPHELLHALAALFPLEPGREIIGQPGIDRVVEQLERGPATLAATLETPARSFVGQLREVLAQAVEGASALANINTVLPASRHTSPCETVRPESKQNVRPRFQNLAGDCAVKQQQNVGVQVPAVFAQSALDGPDVAVTPQLFPRSLPCPVLSHVSPGNAQRLPQIPETIPAAMGHGESRQSNRAAALSVPTQQMLNLRSSASCDLRRADRTRPARAAVRQTRVPRG